MLRKEETPRAKVAVYHGNTASCSEAMRAGSSLEAAHSAKTMLYKGVWKTRNYMRNRMRKKPIKGSATMLPAVYERGHEPPNRILGEKRMRSFPKNPVAPLRLWPARNRIGRMESLLPSARCFAASPHIHRNWGKLPCIGISGACAPSLRVFYNERQAASAACLKMPCETLYFLALVSTTSLRSAIKASMDIAPRSPSARWRGETVLFSMSRSPTTTM